MTARMTPEEIAAVRAASAGFRGEFRVDDVEIRTPDGAVSDEFPELDHLHADGDPYSITGSIERAVLEPIALMLNAVPRLLAEIEALTKPRDEARSAPVTSDRQLYTSSRLRVLRECPRKHYLRYTLGLQTTPTADMRFGTVGHSALESWYRAWMSSSDGDRRLASALAEAAELPEFERVKLMVLLVAYHERWGGEPWEVLAVEQEFRYELGGYAIGGKIDAIVRDRSDGRCYVVEHKFTGSDTSIGGPYWERLALDTQVTVYIDGAAMLGYDVAGCIYDVIKRPAHAPLIATDPASRTYTVGKGCPQCGGSAKPGAVTRGRGHLIVAFASSVEQPPCEACAGTGWKLDKDGKPQAPHLRAGQREEDETVEEFEERMLAAISARPDDFLQRAHVMRLEHELPALRTALVEWVALAETGLAPPNDSACVRAGRMCDFFNLCAGRATVDEYRRGPVHPELAQDGPP